MSVFDGLASVYDVGMLPLEWLIFRRLRRRLFPCIGGRVLELGVGTGVNLPLYRSATRVVACDASPDMLACAKGRRTRARVALVQADAQRLPFADRSLDVVAASLTFCSIADPLRGLGEARRILTTHGQLLLLEHMRGSGLGAWVTDVLHPLWNAWSRDCHLNRETVGNVEQAGFTVRRVEQHALGIVRLIEATV